MGRVRTDGSVQSANTPDIRFLAKNKVDLDFGIYRCMISKVNYIDDPENKTFQNKQVTYSAIIIGGKKEGQEIQNIKSGNIYGGQYNFHERIWRAIEPSSKGIGIKPIAEQTGDIVFVAFNQGNTGAPFIISGGTQPLDEDSTGATRADGHRVRSQYNGVFEEINKNGEWEFVRKGGTFNTSKDFFKPTEDTFEARLKFSKNSMLWEDPKSSMEFLKEETKFTLQVNEETIKVEYDGAAEKITKTFKSGMVVTIDGKSDKFEASTSGGAVLTVDGKTNKINIKAGSTEIVIDGNSGKIQLKGDMIDIGASVSDFAVLFSELMTAFNQHTHVGNLGAPTSPPLAPLLQTVASQTVQLQS